MDDSFRSRARASLNEAIGLISDTEKAAYLEALERAPHLFETESDPFCFLERDNYNQWDADGRIVDYWAERKKIFEDKAFFPLTLFGESALSDEVIRAIRSGISLLLPNDNSGRSVMCCHQDRLAEFPIHVNLQAVFYHHFILMRNAQNRKDGYVWLVNKGNDMLDPRRGKLIFEFMRAFMPVKVHSIHLLTTRGSQINPIMLNLWKWYTNEKVYVHMCNTPEECAASLRTFGFKKEKLPKVLGGSWETVQWDGLKEEEQGNWLRDKTFLDTRRYSSSKGNGIDDDNSSSSMTINRSIDATGSNSFEQEQRVVQCQKALGSQEAKPLQAAPHGTSEFDVLLGRGRIHTKHNGNLYYRKLINSHSARYQAAKSRIDKKQIKLEVLNCFKDKGRFMKYDDESNKWKEVSSTYALEKIKESLQNVLRKKP